MLPSLTLFNRKISGNVTTINVTGDQRKLPRLVITIGSRVRAEPPGDHLPHEKPVAFGQRFGYARSAAARSSVCRRLFPPTRSLASSRASQRSGDRSFSGTTASGVPVAKM